MNKAKHSNSSHSEDKEMLIKKMEHLISEYGDEIMELGVEKVKKQMWICMHEAMNGPHFDEETAFEAVEMMEHEDGSTGVKFQPQEAMKLAKENGINLRSEDFNEWDWFVALNMVYSDYCEMVEELMGQADPRVFVKFAKTWLCDKDISEGKMWHYYVYIMCDDDDNEMNRMQRMQGGMNRRRRDSKGRYMRMQNMHRGSNSYDRMGEMDHMNMSIYGGYDEMNRGGNYGSQNRGNQSSGSYNKEEYYGEPSYMEGMGYHHRMNQHMMDYEHEDRRGRRRGR